LIGECRFSTSQQTFDSRVVLLDFLDKAKRVRTLSDKYNAYPNLVLFHEGFLFCSVHLAMRKTSDGAHVQRHVKAFEGAVSADATRAAAVLTAQINDWSKSYSVLGSASADFTNLPIGLSAEAEIAHLRMLVQALLSSRSYRWIWPVRALTTRARKNPVTRSMGRFGLRCLRFIKRRLSAPLNPPAC
jgi:hypothetical protein